MMKPSLFKLTVVAALMALAFVPTSFAAKGNKTPGYKGKVSAMADGSLTVSNRKLGDKTFQTNANTKFERVDGTAGSLSDIKAGSHVRVSTGADASVATEVQMIEKKSKKNAPAAAPSAAPSPSPTAS